MRKTVISAFAVTLLTGALLCLAGEESKETASKETAKMPEMPKPEKQHQWLQQLVGEWEASVEATMEPGKEPFKSKGSETMRSVGGFWVIGENKGICPMDGSPFTGILTLGYDPEKKKYVGTWVDSMTSLLWNYEGTVDAAGKTLTLETEGPCPMAPGKISKFREVIEVKSKDHKTFTSSMQGEDGQWVKMMHVDYRRKG